MSQLKAFLQLIFSIVLLAPYLVFGQATPEPYTILPTPVEVTSFPYLEENFDSDATASGAPTGMVGGCSPITCCSGVWYEVTIEAKGSLVSAFEDFTPLATGLIWYKAESENITTTDQLTYVSGIPNNFCGFGSFTSPSYGYPWRLKYTPSYFNEDTEFTQEIASSWHPTSVTGDEFPVDLTQYPTIGWRTDVELESGNHYVEPGTYWLYAWNYNQQVDNGGETTRLVIDFVELCPEGYDCVNISETICDIETYTTQGGVEITETTTAKDTIGTVITTYNITLDESLACCPEGFACDQQDVTECANITYTTPGGNTVSETGSVLDQDIDAKTRTVYNVTFERVEKVADIYQDAIIAESGDVTYIANTDVTGVLSFDKSLDYWVDMNALQDDLNGTSRSIFMWVKSEANVTSTHQTLFAINSASGGNVSLLWIDDDSDNLEVNDGSNNQSASFNMSGEVWNYVGYTYDAATNETVVYVNGVENDRYTNNQLTASDSQYSLGQEFDNSSTGNFYNGDMAEISVWNEVLTGGEVSVAMREKIDNTHPKYTNLVGYYSVFGACDDDTSILKDHSGKGNDGQMQNGITQDFKNVQSIDGFNSIGWYDNVSWKKDGIEVSSTNTFTTDVAAGSYEFIATRNFVQSTDNWTMTVNTNATTVDNIADETLCSDEAIIRSVSVNMVNYLEFEEEEFNRVEVNSLSDDLVGKSYSAFMWLNKESNIGSGNFDEVLVFQSSDVDKMSRFYVRSTEKIALWDGTNDFIGDGSPALANGTWYHVGYTYDSDTKQATLYVNGEEEGTGTLDLDISEGWFGTIGAKLNDNGYEEEMDGKLAEITIWDKVLSSEEITVLMSAAPAHDAANLVAAYGTIKSTADNVLRDLTSNGHDGIASHETIIINNLEESLSDYDASSNYNISWKKGQAEFDTDAIGNITIDEGTTVYSVAYGTPLNQKTDEFSLSYTNLIPNQPISKTAGAQGSVIFEVDEIAGASYQWYKRDLFLEEAFSIPTNFIEVLVNGNNVYGIWDFGGLYFSNDGGQNFTFELSGPSSVFESPNGLYLTSKSGLYVSTQGVEGLSLKTTANGLPNLNVNSVWEENGTLYVGTNAGLAISTDNGETFNSNYDLGIDDIVRNVYVKNGAVYVATNAGLSISVDNAATFTGVPKADIIGDLAGDIAAVAVTDDGTIYVATSIGLAVSINNGASYKLYDQDDGLASADIIDIVVLGNDAYISNGGIISVTSDAGQSFVDLEYSQGISYLDVSSEKVYALSSNKVIEVAITLPLQNTASSLTNNQIQGAATHQLTINNLTLDQNGTEYFVVVTKGECTQTSDDVTLTVLDIPAITEYIPSRGGLDIEPDADISIEWSKTVIAGATGNLKIFDYSTDAEVASFAAGDVTINGSTLSFSPTNLDYSTTYYITIDADFVKDIGDGGNLALTGKDAWTFSTVCETLVTVQPTDQSGFVDGSATFSVPEVSGASYQWFKSDDRTEELLDNVGSIVDVSATSSGIFVGTRTGLYRSIDNGQNFVQLNDSTNINTVLEKNGVLYVAYDSGLGISIDNGNSFVDKNTGNTNLPRNEINNIAVFDNTLYLSISDPSTSGGLAVSSDNGESFIIKTVHDGLGSNEVHDVFVVEDNIYVGTRSGLSISTNGGLSFENKTTINGLINNKILVVMVASDGTIYAGGLNGLSVSTDSGQTFVDLPASDDLPVQVVRDLENIDDVVYINVRSTINGGGILTTTDGGETLTTIHEEVSTVYGPMAISVLNGQIYAGGAGAILTRHSTTTPMVAGTDAQSDNYVTGATNASLTIDNLTAELDQAEYFVIVTKGECEETSEVATLTVTDAPTPINISSLNPSNGRTEVSRSTSLIINLDSDVAKGTGNIQIKKSSDDELVTEILANGSLVSIEGSLVTIGLGDALLDFGTEYYVTIPKTAFTASGKEFVGITEKTTWSFITECEDFITTQPISQSARIGEDVTLEIPEIEGATYQWTHYPSGIRQDLQEQSGKYEGTTTNSLNILNLENADNGSRFQLEVTIGNCTKSTEQAFLTIAVDPLTLVSTTPANGTTEVGITDDLILTFSENIDYGSGSGTVTIRRTTDDSDFLEVHAPSIEISGATAIISFGLLETQLESNTSYYLLVPNTLFKSDASGALFAGINDKTTWTFTTSEKLKIVSLTPANGSIGIAENDFTMVFNQPVQPSYPPTMRLFLAEGDVEVGQVNYNSSVLDFSEDKKIVNFYFFDDNEEKIILEQGQEYYIIGENFFANLDNSEFIGISDKTTWTFTTEEGPFVQSSISPENAATNVAVSLNDNVFQDSNDFIGSFSGHSLRFFRNQLTAGTSGKITLHKQSDDEVVYEIDISESPISTFDFDNRAQVNITDKVSIANLAEGGSILNIRGDITLEGETEYYWTVDASVINDDDRAFAGISDKTSWAFTTGFDQKPFIIILSSAFQVGREIKIFETHQELTYDYTVDWGDGAISSSLTGDASHTYSSEDVFTIKVYGVFPGFKLSNFGTKSVEQWGEHQWETMVEAFEGREIIINAADAPDLTAGPSMASMFYNAKLGSPDLTGWDVSTVTDMTNMFSSSDFNGDISNWNVSAVTNMNSMFASAESFNGDITAWKPEKVESMKGMFSSALAFNSDIGAWTVSNVLTMENMFGGATTFNQDLSDWETGKVTNMFGMFQNADKFNQSLDAWDVSKVENMSRMFKGADIFNQDLNSWKVGAVKNFKEMFSDAHLFNGEIGNWDVSKGEDFESMFEDARTFNQDISRWNLAAAIKVDAMFRDALVFNQPVGEWRFPNVSDTERMFYNAEKFNQDITEWEMGGITDVSSMFENADAFNQDISSWDMSAVTDFSWMFGRASSFNQDISGWNVGKGTNFSSMFREVAVFNQDLSSWNVTSATNMDAIFNQTGLTIQNYDAILTSWSEQEVNNEVSFGVEGLKYCNGETARQSLIDDHNWQFGDDSKDCTIPVNIVSLLPMDNALSLDPNSLNTSIPNLPRFSVQFAEPMKYGDLDAVFELYDGETDQLLASQTLSSTVAGPGVDNTNHGFGFYNYVFEEGTSYYILVEPGMFLSISNDAPSVGITNKTVWNFETLAPPAPPVLISTEPSNTSTGISINANLVLIFNENVQAGFFGETQAITYVRLFEEDGMEAATFATNELGYNGSVVTINSSMDFAYSTSYYVLIDEGAFKNFSNEAYEGLTDITAITFSTEEKPNTLPTASEVALEGNLEVNQTLSGTYSFLDDDGNTESGSSFQWYIADDESGANQQMISSATLQSIVLSEDQTGKYISFAVTPNDGIDKGEEVFSPYLGPIKAAVVPTLVSTEPIDGAVDVSADVTLSFELSEAVNKGSGNLTLTPASGTATVIDVRSTEVTITGTSIAVDPSSDLLSGAFYTVTYDATAFTDSDGNNSEGLTSQTKWNFTTKAANVAPEAQGVSIKKSLVVDGELEGSYTFFDENGDEEVGTTYTWYRSDDISATGKTAISGASNSNYSITSEDDGKYVSFEVTPSDGALTGESVESELFGPVLVNDGITNIPPAFTSDAITTVKDNETYSYTITYEDLNNDVPELSLTSGPDWLSITDFVLSGNPGVENVGEVEVVLTLDDQNGGIVTQKFTLEVLVSNTAPSLAGVEVAGELEIGQTLTGTYNFIDAENDTDNSTYQWYRSDDESGTAREVITGATDVEYLLTADDAGKYLSMEVSPNDGKIVGVSALSDFVGPVNKKTPSLVFTAINKNYGDETFNLEATTNSTGNITYSFSDNNTGAALNGATVTLANIGSITVNVSLAEDAEFTSREVMGTIVVDKRVATVVAVNASKTYGEQDPTLAFEVTNGSLLDGDAVVMISRNTGNDVGNYAINLEEGQDASNYDLTLTDGTFEISKRAITLTTPTLTKVYGDADPEISYSITESDLISSDVLEGSLTRASGEDVGEYDIENGLFNGNYEIALNTSPFTITKKSLVVTADNKQKDFGAENPELTFSYTGFAFADDATVLDEEPTISTIADVNSPSGEYDILLEGGADNNYSLELVKATLTINLAPENTLPTVTNALPDKTEDEGFASNTVDLTNVFTDADNDALNYTASSSSEGIATVSVSGSTLTYTEVAVGTTTIMVTADDGNGGTVSDEFDLTINAVNNAPVVANAITDKTENEGFGSNRIDLTNVFTDADNNALTFTANSSAEGIATVSVSGNTLTYTEVAVGTTTITVTADDGNGGTVSDEFDLTINAVNNAPVVVNAIEDKTEDEGFGSNTVDLTNVFTDADNDALTFTANSSAEGIATVSVSGNTLTYTEVAVGTTTITVTADDGNGGTVTDEFDLTINAVNNAPVVANAIADKTEDEGFASNTVDLSNVFTDADNDALTFRASSSAEGVATVSVSGSTLTYTEVAVGIATITVTANDGNGGTVSNEFDLTINAVAVNNAPVVANAIADITEEEGFASNTVDLTNVFSDADNDALNYTVSSSSESIATVSVSGNTLTYTEVAVGTTTITVTADDGNGGTVSDEFDLTINAVAINNAPVVANAIADKKEDEGFASSTVDLTNVFSDADNDALNYTVSSSSESIATVSVSGNTLTYTEEAVGTTTITVTADDGKGGTVSDEFDLTINAVAVNNAPVVANSIADKTEDEGFASNTVDLTNVFTDADNDALTYTASSSAEGIATVSVSGNTLTYTEVSVGTTTITVTADDGNGGTVSDEFDLTINAVAVNNAPVVANAIADITEEEGFASNTVDLTNVFTDADNDALTYTASSSAEGIATVSVSGNALTYTEVAVGTTTITVTVDDGNGGTVSDEFDLTINAVNNAPVISNAIADKTEDEGFASNTVDLTNVFTDADNDALTYTASSAAEGIATVSISGNTLTYTEVAVGTTTITVTADDGNGGTVSDEFDLTINAVAVNNAPTVANAIEDQTEDEGFSSNTIDLTNVFTDADSDMLTYSATSSDLTIADVMVSGTSLQYFEESIGVATIIVTATDGRGGSVTDEFTLTILAPTVPPEPEIPQGFSPNGDGVNDMWQVPNIENFPNNKVIIFDRQGNKVFEAEGYNNDDVSFEGLASSGAINTSRGLADGVYYYIIDLGNGEQRKGHIIIKQ